MGQSLKIATLGGVPIKVHWSFLLIFVAIYFYFANRGVEYQLHLSLYVIIIFLCITLHELGHAFAAKYCRIDPIDIIITPLGGGTRFMQSAMKPAQELIITIAGPLMNVLIVGITVLWLSQLQDGLNLRRGFYFFNNLPFYNWTDFLRDVMLMNVILVLFNMLPAFPMDGGRILRALLSFKFSRQAATRIAAIIGQLFAIGFIGYTLFFGSQDIVLIVVSAFIFIAAGSENRSVRVIETLKKYSAGEVMRTEMIRLHTEMTIKDAAFYLAKDDTGDFIVENELGDFKGLVLREKLSATLKEAPAETPIEACLTNQFEIVRPTENFEPLFFKLHEGKVAALIVQEEEDSEVLGIIDIARLNAFLRESGIIREHWIQKWAKK